MKKEDFKVGECFRYKYDHAEDDYNLITEVTEYGVFYIEIGIGDRILKLEKYSNTWEYISGWIKAGDVTKSVFPIGMYKIYLK